MWAHLSWHHSSLTARAACKEREQDADRRLSETETCKARTPTMQQQNRGHARQHPRLHGEQHRNRLHWAKLLHTHTNKKGLYTSPANAAAAAGSPASPAALLCTLPAAPGSTCLSRSCACKQQQQQQWQHSQGDCGTLHESRPSARCIDRPEFCLAATCGEQQCDATALLSLQPCFCNLLSVRTRINGT
jgi:hypothetical protein